MMYKKMYYTLFNAATDALEAMEAQNYGRAADILKTAQQRAEELYVEGDGQWPQSLDNLPL